MNESKVLRINSYSVCRTTAWTESGFSDQRFSTWQWSPVRHLSFGCWGCPARRELTYSEPLKSIHWGAWASSSLSSFFLFPWYLIRNPILYFLDIIQLILTRGRAWNFSIPITANCLCILRKNVWKSLSWADFLSRWLRQRTFLWIEGPSGHGHQRNAPGLPTSLLSEAHF